MFWERFFALCDSVYGKKPNALLNELGISSGTLSNWKNKGMLPDGKKLIELSQIFEVSIDYLLTGKSSEPKLTDKEEELLKHFRRLPESEQWKLIGRTETLAESYKEDGEQKIQNAL